jgi:hypothetical protein
MAATAKTSVTPKKKTVKTAPASTTAKAKTGSKPAVASAKTKNSTKTAVTAKKSPTKAAAPKVKRIDPRQRRNYIEMAAYYIAERRGFVGGNEADDWAAAEVEIDRLLVEGKLNG